MFVSPFHVWVNHIIHYHENIISCKRDSYQYNIYRHDVMLALFNSSCTCAHSAIGCVPLLVAWKTGRAIIMLKLGSGLDEIPLGKGTWGRNY